MNPQSTAEAAGRTTGQILVVALLLWGIFKCWSISRRPATNTKCVLGLMLLLVAWLVASLGSILLRDNPDVRILYGLIALGAFGLVVSSVVLAIIGLVEYVQHRERFNQGRSQAVWALVLCGLFLTFAGYGFVASFKRSSLAIKQQPTADTPLFFEDLNFKFSAPGKPWVQVEAIKLNPYAKLAFLRMQPQVYFLIIAERDSVTDFSSEELADIAAAHLKSVAETAREVKHYRFRAGQLNGVCVQTEGRVGGFDAFYVQRFYATNGWAYQLMAWGTAQNRQAIIDEAEQMTGRFELIDTQSRPLRVGKEVVEDFVSTNYQYRVRSSDSKWIAWPKIDTDCPYASYGVVHRENAVLAVSAVCLRDLDSRPEAIYKGFLRATGLFSDVNPLMGAKEIREKNLTGIETDINRLTDSGAEYTYRFKVLQGGGFAYLVSAWVESKHPRKEELLNDVMSRVEFFEGDRPKPDLADMDERERRVQRLLLSSVGMVYYDEQQYEKSSRYFKVAVDLAGTNKTTLYLANLTGAYTAMGKLGEALDELNRHPDFVNAQPPLQAQHAFLEGRLGQTDLALTNYARLFASGYKAEDHFKEYIALLAQTEQTDRALSEVDSYLKKQDSPGVRLWQAELLKRQKKFDEAIAVLKEQRDKNPFHAGIAYALGDALIQSGRPNEALAVSQELMNRQGSSANAWHLKGRAEFALKWYREAKESFEHALKESPTDSDVKSFLNAVSSVLGEGSNIAVKEPIAPVSVPEELLSLPPVPGENYGREEGAYYSRRLTAVSFERGKELKTTEYLRAKTITATGVSAFSTFQIVFNPLNEELYVNRLEVHDPTGNLVSTGRVSDSYVLDDRSTSQASTRKVLNLPISGLQLGCIIELVYTRREFGRAEEFTYLPFNFSGTVPIQENVLYVTGNTNAIKYVSSFRLEPQAVGAGLCWRQTNPPVIRWEPLLPTDNDYLPMVWVADTSARWPGLVTNYLDTISDRLVLPDEQRQLARQLTAQTTNLAEKIAIIGNYIQTNYTYKAIEFGRRARVPQPLTSIIQNKYGDCKDHAALAQQMLNAAGVPAVLALVSFAMPLRRDLPSLDQFDHMLVYIPATSGNSFLDCTAKSADLRSPWSLNLAGREALILDVKNPRFVRLPNYPTNASVIHTERSVELTNQTDALVHEHLTFVGVHACYFRDYFLNQSAAGRRAYVAGQFVGTAGELVDMALKGLEQPQLPLELQLTYLLRKQFNTLGNQIVGSSPIGFERAFLSASPVEKRALPFEVAIPLTIDGTVTVKVPLGFKAKLPAESVGRIGNAFVTCHSATELNDNGWRITFKFYEPTGRFAANEYGNFCQALQQAMELLKPRLVGESLKR